MISTIFKFLSKHLTIFLLGGLVLAVLYGWHQNKQKRLAIEEIQKQINNIEALNDSVRVYRNEAGELSAEKLALQTDTEQLKQLNRQLSMEVQKERDRVESITQASLSLSEDSVKTDTVYVSTVGNTQYKITWEKRDKGEGWSRVLEGYVQYSPDSTGAPTQTSAEITQNSLNLQITTGIADDNGQKRIFFRTTYPNLRVTGLNGAVIEDSRFNASPKRWYIGPNVGYGVTGEGKFRPYLGISVGYGIFRF